MNIAARFLRRDPAEVKPWAETCGQIRPLIEEADGADPEVHHVEIEHARLHYREKTDEAYYVIGGKVRWSWTARKLSCIRAWSSTRPAA